MALGGLGHGKLPADHRPKRTVFQARDEGGVDALGFPGRSIEEHHAQNFSIPTHGVPRIDFRRSPASDNHHPALARQYREILAKVDIGKDFQNDIEPAVFREGHGLLEIFGSVVVQGEVRALFQD